MVGVYSIYLLLSSSLSLSSFNLAVPMHAQVFGKHSCMSSSFPIVILNDTSIFPTVQLEVHKREFGARWRH